MILIPENEKECLMIAFAETRKALGLNQHEMADRLGTSQAAISRYEKGLLTIPSTTLIEFPGIAVKARKLKDKHVCPAEKATVTVAREDTDLTVVLVQTREWKIVEAIDEMGEPVVLDEVETTLAKYLASNRVDETGF
jgi:transcriptional regulator with XRE-family HTH domain